MMIAPLFPIPMGIFTATIDFIDFTAGQVLKPQPGIRLTTGPLNHPNDATGYRIEYGGKIVAYITDTEHRPDALDPNVLKLIDGADVMIYDASYTDAEYLDHRDWGHSTWEEGVRLANAAGVKTLVIFHHDPVTTMIHGPGRRRRGDRPAWHDRGPGGARPAPVMGREDEFPAGAGGPLAPGRSLRWRLTGEPVGFEPETY